MSDGPFVRRRAREDIIGSTGPPCPLRFRWCGSFGFAWGLAILLVGCAVSGPTPPARFTRFAEIDRRGEEGFDVDERARLDRLRAVLDESALPGDASGLSVRLAFDEAVDLDLFVTDPVQESVYFANSPTRSGGRLIQDRRCGDPSPRVEVVHFPHPMSGRYRVGVDHHGVCGAPPLSEATKDEAVFLVRAEWAGQVSEREGRVLPGEFDVIVLEFVVDRIASESVLHSPAPDFQAGPPGPELHGMEGLFPAHGNLRSVWFVRVGKQMKNGENRR